MLRCVIVMLVATVGSVSPLKRVDPLERNNTADGAATPSKAKHTAARLFGNA